jgi:hypothetical protein
MLMNAKTPKCQGKSAKKETKIEPQIAQISQIREIQICVIYAICGSILFAFLGGFTLASWRLGVHSI